MAMSQYCVRSCRNGKQVLRASVRHSFNNYKVHNCSGAVSQLHHNGAEWKEVGRGGGRGAGREGGRSPLRAKVRAAEAEWETIGCQCLGSWGWRLASSSTPGVAVELPGPTAVCDCIGPTDYLLSLVSHETTSAEAPLASPLPAAPLTLLLVCAATVRPRLWFHGNFRQLLCFWSLNFCSHPFSGFLQVRISSFCPNFFFS